MKNIDLRISSHLVILLLFSCCLHFSTSAQSLYFPPLAGAEVWETKAPEELGWCTEYIDTLYNFLEAENTKAFLVLKDGRIVLKKYFGTFQQDSLWYWASAGKTITAFLMGMAQQNGDLDITESSNTYLGGSWTDCIAEQENNITLWNQLTMTSGLDDGVPDNHCTIDTCLQFLTEPETRWAYHNAPYSLLESVLENATATDINIYTYTQLKIFTGITGFWLTLGYDNVYFSDARSMARFGLLIQNNGNWDGNSIMSDSEYFNAMINTSQELNKSYGYLWWLNGKESYMVPGLQFVFPGSYAPDAPDDMFAGLGKNGQILSIAPESGIVMIRMGNIPSSDFSDVPSVLCTQMWKRLNDIMCSSSSLETDKEKNALIVFPNPANNYCTIQLPDEIFDLIITDLHGIEIYSAKNIYQSLQIDIKHFIPEIYFLTAITANGNSFTQPLIIE